MQITIYYGNQNLGSYDLEQFHKEVVSFGRQPDNDIVLNYILSVSNPLLVRKN